MVETIQDSSGSVESRLIGRETRPFESRLLNGLFFKLNEEAEEWMERTSYKNGKDRDGWTEDGKRASREWVNE